MTFSLLATRPRHTCHRPFAKIADANSFAPVSRCSRQWVERAGRKFHVQAVDPHRTRANNSNGGGHQRVTEAELNHLSAPDATNRTTRDGSIAMWANGLFDHRLDLNIWRERATL